MRSRPVEHLARVDAGVPHVSDLKTRHQRERLRPIGARVAGDRGLGVAFGALLHVTRLGRAASVQSRAIAPLRIEAIPYGGSVTMQQRLALAEQPRDVFRAGRVAAQHAVLAAEPQITRPRLAATSGSGGAWLAFSSSIGSRSSVSSS